MEACCRGVQILGSRARTRSRCSEPDSAARLTPVSVSPELVSELLDLPEAESVDLAWRLLETLHQGSSTDSLDDEDRERLHLSLRRSEDDVRAGRLRPAADLIAELRGQRTR